MIDSETTSLLFNDPKRHPHDTVATCYDLMLRRGTASANPTIRKSIETISYLGRVNGLSSRILNTLIPVPTSHYRVETANKNRREAIESNDTSGDLKACHCCGLIHRVPFIGAGDLAKCTRCGSTIGTSIDARQSAARTAAAALGALLLFFPAILLPILNIERLGQKHESSILSGTIDLIRHGDWFVGIIVLLFSVVFPLVKIVLLLELSWLSLLHRRRKALTYQIMEHVGKWSMMDVMLLAFMVMLVKLGNLVEFHFGPAVLAFVFCVAMSMFASLSFDPHVIWEDDDQKSLAR